MSLDKGHHGPCIKCSRRTPSPSGYCELCRKFVCKGCQQEFTGRVMGISKCSACKKRKLA